MLECSAAVCTAAGLALSAAVEAQPFGPAHIPCDGACVGWEALCWCHSARGVHYRTGIGPAPETDLRAYISCIYPPSAEKKRELALPAGVVAGMGAMMAHPLVAEAGVTPRSETCVLGQPTL